MEEGKSGGASSTEYGEETLGLWERKLYAKRAKSLAIHHVEKDRKNEWDRRRHAALITLTEQSYGENLETRERIKILSDRVRHAKTLAVLTEKHRKNEGNPTSHAALISLTEQSYRETFGADEKPDV